MLLLVNEQITKFVNRKFQGKDSKDFMKFQTGVSKFQFKDSFSTLKFPIRGSKFEGGVTREPF